MQQLPQTQVQCPNCGSPIMATLEQIIDGGRDPMAKARLLSGRVNTVVCPNCQAQFGLATPLVYHDGNKELLIVFVPMELGLQHEQRERLIGQMTNAIVNSLPQEERKGYLLMPKNALSLQGLMEMILEADGITKEVIEARQAKLSLVEGFLSADQDQWPELVAQHDSDFDEEFFTILLATADAAVANQQQEAAQQILELREYLLEHSSTGQTLLAEAQRQESMIQAVANKLQALGNPTRAQMIDLVLELAEEDEEQLQVLVGIARPVLDYQFFVELNERIEQSEGEAHTQLNALRDQLLDLTQRVDQQAEGAIQDATALLEELAHSEDLDADIRRYISEIDDTFMAVLSSNIRHAEQQHNHEAAEQLKHIFERIMGALEASAPPPVQFINQLMRAESFEQAQAMLQEHASEFGPPLLELMDVLMQELAQQNQQPTLQQLKRLRVAAAQVLGAETPADRQANPSPIILPFDRNRGE